MDLEGIIYFVAILVFGATANGLIYAGMRKKDQGFSSRTARLFGLITFVTLGAAVVVALGVGVEAILTFLGLAAGYLAGKENAD